ncbi:MAG TPA: (d)CMP kinase [Chloroflexi bacterium]|nr:(d)CMP kinase [Chloroflexota bacterium]
MDMVNTIALDGPAASGKSTVGEKLAEYLGYLFFDTGVMYRAITLAAIEAGIQVEDEQACTKLAEETQIDVRPPSKSDGRRNDILIGGEDKTWEIRSSKVDAYVSVVSAYPGVRQALTEKQRAIGKRGKVVMVGRDIGTVVMPDATLKIYLDASVEERARRRFQERVSRGESADYEQVLEILRQRDLIDSSRDVAPLRPAEDAVLIDSDSMSAQQVLARLLALVAEKDLR